MTLREMMFFAQMALWSLYCRERFPEAILQMDRMDHIPDSLSCYINR